MNDIVAKAAICGAGFLAMFLPLYLFADPEISPFYGGAETRVALVATNARNDATEMPSQSETAPIAVRDDKSTKQQSPQSQSTQSKKDQLLSIFDSMKIEGSNLRIVSSGTEMYDITYDYSAMAWNETDFVRHIMSDYINFCKQAYAIDGVSEVHFYIYVDLTDAKGNKINEKGMSIAMPKDKFATYDWSNLEYRKGIYTTFEADCTDFFIHLGIRQNVDFDDIYYRGEKYD